MRWEKPLIYLFNTPLGYYIFDVNRNRIIKTQKPVYEALSKEQSVGEAAAAAWESEEKSIIDGLKEDGFLSSFRSSEIRHPKDDMLESILDGSVPKITLQITQACNLRCRYCPYSNNDGVSQRQHANNAMSFDIAKKSIDFLINHSKDLRQINIGFYGGEPLLEFELIKKCVAYANDKAEGKNLTYSMTTNGTLLDEEKVEFLQENNVMLVISLDGPRENHDRNRRFAVNGCGTFDTIMERIERLKLKYPEYIAKVAFNIVIDPEADFCSTNDFYMGFDAVKGARLSSTVIDTKFSNEGLNFTEDYVIKRSYETYKMYLNKLGKLDKQYVSPISEREFYIFQAFVDDFVPSYRLPETVHHGGPCVPGGQRLFIDINGNMFPCERCSETSEVMKIGHIDTGFDIDKARVLLNIGKLTESECKNCWAIRGCRLCATMADNVKELSAELKRGHCRMSRNIYESNLKDYAVLKELGYTF